VQARVRRAPTFRQPRRGERPYLPDDLLETPVCDDCGLCSRACPAAAIGAERTVQLRIGHRIFSHAPFDAARCCEVHQGWDPRYSPFLKRTSTRETPPHYYQLLDHRFRHRSTCGARGCVRMCVHHLEQTGRIQKQYRTPMIEGKQWVLEE